MPGVLLAFCESTLALGGMLAVPIGVRAEELSDAEVALRAADACNNIERGMDEALRSRRAAS